MRPGASGAAFVAMKLLGLLVMIALAAPAQAQNPGLGKRLFQAQCASCHGVSASGNGWLAQYLTHRPANLTLLARRNGGVFPADGVRAAIDGRADVLLHGPRDMPVWGERYENALKGSSNAAAAARRRIDALVDYLGSIQE